MVLYINASATAFVNFLSKITAKINIATIL